MAYVNWDLFIQMNEITDLINPDDKLLRHLAGVFNMTRDASRLLEFSLHDPYIVNPDLRSVNRS
jgi:hypothetical protein